MTLDELFSAIRQKPFEPFHLHLANGDTVAIRHRDMIAIDEHCSSLGVAGSPLRILPLKTIEKLEFQSPK